MGKKKKGFAVWRCGRMGWKRWCRKMRRRAILKMFWLENVGISGSDVLF